MSDGIAPAYPGSIFSLTDHELFVVTARADSRENGQIATWIMPASLVADAPRLVAVISPSNLTHDLIRESGRFAISMLAEGQEEFVPLFGLVSGRDIDKLDGLLLDRTSSGLPVLPGSCGWAEAVIIASIDAGDRMVYLGDIVQQHVYPARSPLRKYAAFERQSDDIRALLEEKHKRDGMRDRELMKRFF